MPELQEIAAHYNRSVAQLAIRYALAKGTLPLPKANHPEYVAQNADVDFYEENLAVWQAMEEAVQAGKVKSIGVSNFNNEDVKNILDNGSITPAVNQIIFHIGMTQDVNQPFDEAGIDRDTLTISTKIDASIKDYRHAATSIDESLAALNMDYIDLLLIHAPRPWNQMEVPNVRPSRGNN
ncbi:aldo/keto reductase [Weissella confusa]|uniref:Aldo/keto reductase n=1 Tax=Weissella confusa TaxID=1583 RepID=A0A923ND04_WEICO|nr:aldo/keto reductase [Weissella confusa]